MGQMLGCGLSSGKKRDDALEVFRRVEIPRDLPTEEIELTFIGRPPGRVGAKHTPPDTVWSEKAILDALRERVLEYGTAEVVVRIGRFVTTRRCRHPELRCR